MAGLATKEDYQGLATAVSLGITVLKRTKQNTWAELTAAMSATDPVVVKAFKVLELDDAQIGTIMAYQAELGLLRIAPSVIPVICPACGHYILSSDTASTRCLVKPGCPGKPFKVVAATTAKKPVEVTEAAPEAATQAAPVAEPAAVPELAVLKADMEDAVETVKEMAEEFLAADSSSEPEYEETDEAPPAPPAPRGPIALDDDNGFD
ncbi:MAG TPA: hypothetical protein VF867_10070 [Arthrobacter sp.]